jgi:hypothetical protein
MKNSTYTSNVLSQVDLPKTHVESAEFTYGFFTPDESLVESPSPKRRVTPDIVKSVLLKSPRYVTLTITPPVTKRTSLPNSKAIQTVRENLTRVYSSEDVGNSGCTTVTLQDTGMLDRLYDMINRSASMRGIEGNFTDVTQELGYALGNAVDRKLLQTLGSRYAAAGAQFVTDRVRIGSGKFGQARENPYVIVISDKFVNDALNSAADTLGVGVADTAGMLDVETRAAQADARRENQAISSNDYITFVDPISTRESSSKQFYYDTSLMAILVYRRELLPDGNSETRLIDVLPSDTQSYVDFNVKLGATYFYWTHAVYSVSTSAITANTGQVVTAEILMQSEPSDSYKVRTNDEVPPPPPSDLSLRWDYQQKKLVVSWTFPPNPQRDIKYFQVFRRRETAEPFELLVEYDFNDSFVSPTRNENVLELNTRKLNSPLTVYVDSDFRKDSKFIYTLASVDARGMISNYSAQIEATFDLARNRLVTKHISPGGAPRPYPNVFLKGDLFLDSIVTTNKRRLKVYFDPEYLKLLDRSGNDLNLFSYEDKAKYKVTVIDVDRAEQITLDMSIRDLLHLRVV